MLLSSNWNRTAAVGTLLLIWLIWSLEFLRPDIMQQDRVISELPAFDSDIGSQAGKTSSSTVTPNAPYLDSYPLDNTRPLVLYTYVESDNARENLAFFVRNGLNHRADFVFIFNGETDAPDMLPSDQFPNIRVVKRPNTCFDIGAHGEVLRKDDLWKGYKRFILMNASIRGPFMPTYAPGCWMDSFLGRLNDKVKLVGTTVNCHPRVHVQSMLLATDDIGLSIMLDPALAYSAPGDDFAGTSADPIGMSPCFETMALAMHAEIGMMALIESQGYRADVLMTAPHTESRLVEFCDAIGYPEDFLYRDHYLGTSVHPYETIFMKANREIDPVLLERLTEWHLAANMTSWDVCGR